MVSRFFFHLEIYRSSFIHADNRCQFKRKHISGEGKKCMLKFLSSLSLFFYEQTEVIQYVSLSILLELKYENEQRISWRQHLFNGSRKKTSQSYNQPLERFVFFLSQCSNLFDENKAMTWT